MLAEWTAEVRSVEEIVELRATAVRYVRHLYADFVQDYVEPSVAVTDGEGREVCALSRLFDVFDVFIQHAEVHAFVRRPDACPLPVQRWGSSWLN